MERGEHSNINKNSPEKLKRAKEIVIARRGQKEEGLRKEDFM